jgi:hypothetical protein
MQAPGGSLVEMGECCPVGSQTGGVAWLRAHRGRGTPGWGVRRKIAMTAGNLEEMRAAYRELQAARQEWARAFANARSTLRYEDLLPVAQRLDAAFERFMKASEALINWK